MTLFRAGVAGAGGEAGPHGVGWTQHQLRHLAPTHLAADGRSATELPPKFRHTTWAAPGFGVKLGGKPPPASPPNMTPQHIAAPAEHPYDQGGPLPAYVGNACLAAILGNAAAGATRTSTFLGEKYRRIARRRGSNAPTSPSAARSWSSPPWDLQSGPDPATTTPAPATTPTPERRKCTHTCELQALGCTVTL